VDESTLSALLAEEGRVPKAQRALAARVAAGSIVKAKSFDLAEFERRRRPWFDFLTALSARAPEPTAAPDWKGLFDSTKALTENRDDFEETLKTGYTLLRDLVQIALAGPQAQVVNADALPRLRTWAAKLGLENIERLKEGLDEAYRLQVRNVNQQLGLEAVALDVLENPASSAAPAT
jgi:hypothetical protein